MRLCFSFFEKAWPLFLLPDVAKRMEETEMANETR